MTTHTSNLFTGRIALAVMFAAGAVCSLCSRPIPPGFLLATIDGERPVCSACAEACDPELAKLLGRRQGVASKPEVRK